MSNTIRLNFTAVSIFQAHFGAAPGVKTRRSSAKNGNVCVTSCSRIANGCAELEKARLDNFCKDFKPEFSREEIYAQVDRETTIEQVISDLEHVGAKKA